MLESIQEGIVIREGRAEDAVSLCPYLMDRENSQFVLYNTPKELQEVMALINRWISSGPFYVMAQKEAAVGFVSYTVLEKNPHTARIGYFLKKGLWGRGITPRAVQLTTRHLFERTDLIRIEATVKPENLQSQRCLEKAGYTFVSRLDQYRSSAKGDESRIRLLYEASRSSFLE